jgi:hypothetical protein
VVLGFSTGNPDPGAADPGGPTSSSSATADAEDPLDLGATLVNQKCNGKTIVVVGYGDADDQGELNNAVSANSRAGVKYLETSKSCNTLYGGEDDLVPPTYAVYLGPYDSRSEPCSIAMAPEHALTGDTVTNLKPGIKVNVPCLCVLEPVTLPKLSVGMDATSRDGVFIRALQELLVGIDLLKPSQVTGRYDRATSREIGKLQTLNAISTHPSRSVDTETWLIARDRGCVNYDF